MRAARSVALVAVAAGLLSVVVGYASSSPLGVGTLATNNASVGRCETDGVSIVQNLSGSNVVSVTIGQIASACGGATLSVTVDNHTASSTGSGTVPGGGGSMTVSLASGVAAKDSEQIDIAIMGP